MKRKERKEVLGDSTEGEGEKEERIGRVVIRRTENEDIREEGTIDRLE